MSSHSLSFTRLAILAVATAPLAILTGCGIGATAPSQITSASTFGGMVHGGPNPVTGATVNLYSTGTGSYGATGTLLGTATTASDGSFHFSGASTCTSPSQVYITSTGGDPGAGANTNYILMAALGDCSTINTSSVIWIDEVTTVAAGYALSNFISISGNTVNVGAPITNSVGAGSCTGTGGSMSCNAAGLKHAFQNALNLASSVGTAATPPTGAAYFTIPGNATAAQTVVPQALINSIANSVESCVNSNGGAATDTSTACGKLFSYTTPPATSSATPAAPTNTLQAVVNMAKFPENNVSNIITLPAGLNTFYNPSLTGSGAGLPHDLSIGIAYKGVTISSTSTAFGYPFFLSLDANDNVYVITEPTNSGTNPMTAISMSSNGAGAWVSATINGTVACQAAIPCQSAPDTAGTLWLATGSTTAGKLFPINVNTGSVGTALTQASTAFAGLAIDRSNNVYIGVPTANAPASVYAMAAGTSSLSPVQAGGVNFSTTAVPLWLSLDNSSNLWIADKYTAGSTSVVSQLLTPTSFSAYTSAATQTADATTADGGMYGLVSNNTGTAYGNNGLKLLTIASGNTATTITTITDGTSSAVSARYSAMDGNGQVYMPDNSGGLSYTWQYFPPNGTYAGGFVAMLPCLNTAANSNTCGSSGTGSSQGPRNAAIDSTGSIWVASSTNGNVLQIIGTAAPTWPQLSYLKTGVTP